MKNSSMHAQCNAIVVMLFAIEKQVFHITVQTPLYRSKLR